VALPREASYRQILLPGEIPLTSMPGLSRLDRRPNWTQLLWVRGRELDVTALARRALLGLLLVVCAVCSAAPLPSNWPDSAGREQGEAKVRYSYAWTPRARPFEHPGHQRSLLEQRLAAFAVRVERARGVEALPPPVALDSASLSSELDSIIARVEEEAHVAVYVQDLLSATAIYDHYGDTLLNAASNHKIVTTSAAIDLLGPDYIFETGVAFEEGRLYVKGEGDPTLDVEALEVLVRSALEEIGDAVVETVVVDDSAFSSESIAPGFDRGGKGVSYQAPSGALSVNFNTVEVIVYPVEGSARPGVRLEPDSTRARVINRARTTHSSAGRVQVETRAGQDALGPITEIVVSGRIPKSGLAQVLRRRVADPGLFAGGVIARTIAVERGVDAPGVERGVRPIALREIAYRASPPLLEITSRVLAYSNNFIAEQLLRTLGWRLTGDPGDWENGREVLAGYWSALGQSMDEIRFQNGSGLSREGRISAQALVDLIAVAERNQVAGKSVLDALPLAGEEGTLRARLRKSGKRVRAKTGTLDGVSALSGIISAEDGTPQVAFSIISNVRKGEAVAARERKALEDHLILALLTHIDDWQLRWAIEILEAEEVHAGSDGDAVTQL
jgi:D-alanyl-D-alanine carboxypeptidase/D-alanyl-D-alanine-endopeptidase (penicillin-binding protein 4)